MSQQLSVELSDLSEGSVDDTVGERVLRKWEQNATWLPENFSDEASVVSTELTVCKREIDRRIIATEHTEKKELTQSDYRTLKNQLHSTSEYENREYHVPQGGEWEGGTLSYEVPGSHRETNCTQCSGAGRLSCQNCGASGNVHCPDCGGTGRQETERQCPRCSGSGWYDKDTEIQCSQCAGKGYEVVDDRCMQCRGTGSVTCSGCGGSGQTQCGNCDGEGITHKLEVLYRECEPEQSVEHTTYDVPEKFVTDADGNHVDTSPGSTSSQRPKHEIETRHIDVLGVDYTYEDEPLIGDDSQEKSYSVYYVEGAFKKSDYPKSQTRKIVPIVLGAVTILALAIGYVVFVL